MAAVAPRGNLDTTAQETQMRAGLIALAAALVLAVLLTRSGVAPGYRVVAFLPFFVAAYGVLSALYSVCGFTAFAGCRMTSEGTERVACRIELSTQRRCGMRVIMMSLGLATLATSFFALAS